MEAVQWAGGVVCLVVMADAHSCNTVDTYYTNKDVETTRLARLSG